MIEFPPQPLDTNQVVPSCEVCFARNTPNFSWVKIQIQPKRGGPSFGKYH